MVAAPSSMRLVACRARLQHAVGEDVAALEIGAKLDLVDGEEGHVDIGGHGLHGADPVARVRPE